ncbi:regulator of flagellin synthesis, flgm [Clostridium botulinum C str. Eklund]|nr:regulator of flagellin synthesis, flgm [Clostridium botulinum C str. Eklund]NEZ48415.1 flagellar biosynthesis anti-sigma factor FlgM [Clostridium botulinum]
MKITGISVNKVINIYETNKSKNVQSKKVCKKDTLEISKLGKELCTFENGEVSSTTPERIQEIKNQIAKGTYKVDSKLIAKKMLSKYKDN